jgi:hypothetical protein
MATIKVQGQTHKVSKDKTGKVIVKHPGNPKQTYNLTKLSGSKTISSGVKSVKDYHKKNPVKKGK